MATQKGSSDMCERKQVMRRILARALTDEKFAEEVTCNTREVLTKEGFAEALGAPGIEFFETLRKSDLRAISLSDIDTGPLEWRFTLAASIQWD